MKIQFIERIKEFFEKRKLKKLPDDILEEKIVENIEEKETEKVPKMVEAFGSAEAQAEIAQKVVESSGVSTETKAEMLDKLPHKVKEKLFKESIKSKELMAQKDVNTFVQIIINNKSLQPYDELYYRVDKAFSDLQLSNILEKLEKERPEAYDEEKVLRIVAKQIDINLKKYGSFLPSHAEELSRHVYLKDKNTETGEREFDILNPNDKQRLSDAMKEERDEIMTNEKIPVNESEKKRLTDENIQKQIKQIVDFKMKRQQEISEQNNGKEI